MRRYPNDESIGDMLQRAGLTVAQMMEARQAREMQNLTNAINLLGSLGRMPEAIRSDQNVLKGIDETLASMTGGKIKLPRITETSLSQQWERTRQDTPGIPGAFTPTEKLTRGPQVGEYAPLHEMVDIYALDKRTGGVRRAGAIPAGAKLHMVEQATPSRTLIFNQDTGQYEYGPEIDPGTKILTMRPKETLAEYLAKKSIETKLPTGRMREVHNFLETAKIKGSGPDGSYTKEDIQNAISVLYPLTDLDTKLQNTIISKAYEAARSNLNYQTAPDTPEQASQLAKEKGGKVRKSKLEMVEDEINILRSMYDKGKPPGGQEGQKGQKKGDRTTMIIDRLKQIANDVKHPEYLQARKALEERNIDWRQK